MPRTSRGRRSSGRRDQLAAPAALGNGSRGHAGQLDTPRGWGGLGLGDLSHTPSGSRLDSWRRLVAASLADARTLSSQREENTPQLAPRPLTLPRNARYSKRRCK